MKRRNWAISGTDSEVAGSTSNRSNRNTIKPSNSVMAYPTFSPDVEGRRKVNLDREEKKTGPANEYRKSIKDQ